MLVTSWTDSYKYDFLPTLCIDIDIDNQLLFSQYFLWSSSSFVFEFPQVSNEGSYKRIMLSFPHPSFLSLLWIFEKLIENLDSSQQ